jgi:hypothetical protein
VRDVRDDKNPTTAWTQYSQSLQRRLFKGGVISAEPGNTSILESE